jgi:uncharacterized protein
LKVGDDMKKFLVVIERKPSFTGKSIPGHREFLQELTRNEKLVLAGGFANQSGGAYVLQSSTIEEAEILVGHDPMNQEGDCKYSIKEWSI